MTSLDINRNIELSYLLTNYLLANPEIHEKYGTNSFVVFSKVNKRINKINAKLLMRELEKNRKVVVAILVSRDKNRWRFKIATKDKMPKIPLVSF